MAAPEAIVSCPFCGNEKDLERRGGEWFCPCCSRCWLAFTAEDARWLRIFKIAPG